MADRNGTHLTGSPRTAGYKPSMASYPAWYGAGWGAFSLNIVDAMLRDPVVSLALGYKKAPLYTAEFDISADDPAIQKFVTETLHTFWQKDLYYALESMDYGYAASEALYEDEGDTTVFHGLKPVHPRDATPWVAKGKLAKIHVQGVPGSGQVFLEGSTKERPAKGFWITHEPKYNQWYGRSILTPSWYPWRQKTMEDGAQENLFKWAYKHSVSCFVVRHPDVMFEGPQGNVYAQDLMREMATNIKAGAVMALSNALNEDSGKYQYEIESYAEAKPGGEKIIEYIDFLDKQIMRGICIPDLIITSDGGAGSYSRSQVSMTAFFIAAERILNHALECFLDQILRPLVALNFGAGKKFAVKPKPLTPPEQGAPPPGQPGEETPGEGAGGDDPMAALAGGQADDFDASQLQQLSLRGEDEVQLSWGGKYEYLPTGKAPPEGSGWQPYTKKDGSTGYRRDRGMSGGYGQGKEKPEQPATPQPSGKQQSPAPEKSAPGAKPEAAPKQKFAAPKLPPEHHAKAQSLVSENQKKGLKTQLQTDAKGNAALVARDQSGKVVPEASRQVGNAHQAIVAKAKEHYAGKTRPDASVKTPPDATIPGKQQVAELDRRRAERDQQNASQAAAPTPPVQPSPKPAGQQVKDAAEVKHLGPHVEKAVGAVLTNAGQAGNAVHVSHDESGNVIIHERDAKGEGVRAYKVPADKVAKQTAPAQQTEPTQQQVAPQQAEPTKAAAPVPATAAPSPAPAAQPTMQPAATPTPEEDWPAILHPPKAEAARPRPEVPTAQPATPAWKPRRDYARLLAEEKSKHWADQFVENLKLHGYDDPETLEHAAEQVRAFIAKKPGRSQSNTESILRTVFNRSRFGERNPDKPVPVAKQVDPTKPTREHGQALHKQALDHFTKTAAARGHGSDADKQRAAKAVHGVMTAKDTTPENIRERLQAALDKGFPQRTGQAAQQSPQSQSATPQRQRFRTEEHRATERLRQKGWTDQQIADARAEGLFAPDTITGFQGKAARDKTVDHAIEHVRQTGEPAAYADVDLKNLGGLNAQLGATGANEVYTGIAGILKEEAEKLGGDISLYRHGGDEMSIVGVNVSPEQMKEALGKAQWRIADYVQGKGLHEIDHPKHPGEAHYRGSGINFGVTEIYPHATAKHIISSADRQTELSKKGAKHVEGSKAGAAEPVAPEGQPRGTVRGTGEAGEGVPPGDAAASAAAPGGPPQTGGAGNAGRPGHADVAAPQSAAPVQPLTPKPGSPEGVAGEVAGAFAGLGAASKEAGEARNRELVAKQGYVNFRKPAAVEAFVKDHPDWISEVVDGETRFRPPEESPARAMPQDAGSTETLPPEPTPQQSVRTPPPSQAPTKPNVQVRESWDHPTKGADPVKHWQDAMAANLAARGYTSPKQQQLVKNRVQEYMEGKTGSRKHHENRLPEDIRDSLQKSLDHSFPAAVGDTAKELHGKLQSGVKPATPPAKASPGKEGAWQKAWLDKFAEKAFRRGHTKPEDVQRARGAAEAFFGGRSELTADSVKLLNQILTSDFPATGDAKQRALDDRLKRAPVPIHHASLDTLGKRIREVQNVGKPGKNYTFKHSGGVAKFDTRAQAEKWLSDAHTAAVKKATAAGKMPKYQLSLTDTVAEWEIDAQSTYAAEFRLSLAPHSYACVLFPMPEDVAATVRAIGEAIPESELAADGAERDIHLTLKYGFDDSAKEQVAAILRDWGPVRVRLGQITLFKNPEHNVLKIDVEGDNLRQLHKHLCATVPHECRRPGSYSPHITLAYLQPGCGFEFTGPCSLTGKEITFDAAVFSGQDGSKATLPLAKAAQLSLDAPPVAVVLAPAPGDPCAHCGAPHVRVVDAETIRNASRDDEEFGHVALHEDLPYDIPPGEIWVSASLSKRERAVVVKGACARMAALDAGADPDEAYDAGKEVEQAARDQSRLPGDVHVGVYAEIPAEDTTVFLVDGEKVRDRLQVDFTEGTNSEAEDFVPENEIWIESTVRPDEIPAVVLHEYVERTLMRHHGMDYEHAHPLASETEYAHRGKFTKEDVASLTPEKVMAMLPEGAGVRMSVRHAPAGGVTLAGQVFQGGEFIPADVFARASHEERAKLEHGGDKDGVAAKLTGDEGTSVVALSHGTLEANVAGILKHGLQMRHPTGNKGNFRGHADLASQPTGVYCSPSENEAAVWAEHIAKGKAGFRGNKSAIFVLECNVPEAAILKGEKANEQAGQAKIITQDIPAHAIVAITRYEKQVNKYGEHVLKKGERREVRNGKIVVPNPTLRQRIGQLFGKNYLPLVFRDEGSKALMSLGLPEGMPDDAPTQMSVRHAPVGGIAIAGQEFRGGEFIPADVVAQASDEDRAQLLYGDTSEDGVEWDGTIDQEAVEDGTAWVAVNYAQWQDSDGNQNEMFLEDGTFTAPGGKEVRVYRWVSFESDGDEERLEEGKWTTDKDEARSEGRKYAEEHDKEAEEPEDSDIPDDIDGSSWGEREVIDVGFDATAQVRLDEAEFEFGGVTHTAYRWTTRTDADGEWTLDKKQAVKDGKEYAEENYMPEEDEVDRLVSDLLDGDRDQASYVVGAPDDARVSLEEKEDRLFVNISHPKVEKWTRFIDRDHNGNLFVENDYFVLKPEYRKGGAKYERGFGLAMFSRQVEQAADAGFAYIKTHAAGGLGYSKMFNGHYTWPLFGYDQSLDNMEAQDSDGETVVEAAREKFPDAESVLDIMSTQEGRDWWLANGTGLMHAKFDLSPGSGNRSMQVLKAYAAAQKTKGER